MPRSKRNWFEGVEGRSVVHAQEKSTKEFDNLQLRKEKLQSCLQKLELGERLLREARIEAVESLYAGLIYRFDGTFRKIHTIRAYINHKLDNLQRHINGD